MTTVFVRASDIVPRAVEDGLFAAVASTDRIHRFDAMGAAVWRALAEPRSIKDLVALFAVAFPDTPRAVLAKDLTATVWRMRRDGLLVATRGSPSPGARARARARWSQKRQRAPTSPRRRS